MKKNFYKLAMLALVCGLVTTSCQKETPAPEARTPTSGTSTKVVGGSSETSEPSAPSQGSSNSGCPGHK